MVGLRISPLRGLLKNRFANGYNLFIPSGLKNGQNVLLSKTCKKTNKCSNRMLNRNQEKGAFTSKLRPRALFQQFFNTSQILFDGYLTNLVDKWFKFLKVNELLFDGHLIKHKI